MTTIRENLRKGIFYNAVARYSNVVASILIGATLARLLTPEEFGIVAIISVFIAFFNLLSSFGISSAIVQNKTLSEEDISSIFTFSFYLGLFFSTLFFFLAETIASFYNNPVLINLIRLMSLAIFFNTLKIVPNALCTKKLRFKEIGIVSVVVHIITGVIAIILALYEFSYYALIINAILNGVLLFASFLYLAPVKIKFTFKFNSIKKIARFSTYQFLFQFINYFSGNADNLLIGKFFSATALGFYEKAYKLMMLPVQNLTFVITPVLHPILSDYQNDKKIIYNTYYKIVKFLAIIGFPLSIFLFFSATEIVNIMYGPQWDQSIPVFKYLALAVGIQIVLSSGGSVMQATDRTDLLFLSGLLSTILVLGAILNGVFITKSLTSISFGILIAFAINLFQAFYLIVKVCLEQPFFKFLKVLNFPLYSSILIGLTFYFSSFFYIENYILSIAYKSIIAAVTFWLSLLSSKENYSFVKEYYAKLRHK